jgi:PII-like signaling protein
MSVPGVADRVPLPGASGPPPLPGQRRLVLPRADWRTIVRRLRAAGISGATTQRGIWGFHGDHAPHGDRLLQLGRHVPAVTIVIDSPERIAAAFAVVDDLTDEQGLVTSEVVPAMRPGGDPQARGGIPLG